jgi:hypothetical protein
MPYEQPTRIALFAFFAGVALHTAAAAPPCASRLPAGFTLGEPALFTNFLTDVHCRPLRFHDAHVAWAYRPHGDGAHVYFVACAEYPADEADDAVPAGAKYGGIADPLSAATAGAAQRAAVRELDVPGFDFFSTPAFCGGQLAYWAVEDDTFAALFDLRGRKRDDARRVFAGKPETDYIDHLPQPTWSADGASVTFAPEHERAAPVTLGVP